MDKALLENSLFRKKLEFKTMIYILQHENLELVHHNQTNKTLKNSQEMNPIESCRKSLIFLTLASMIFINFQLASKK